MILEIFFTEVTLCNFVSRSGSGSEQQALALLRHHQVPVVVQVPALARSGDHTEIDTELALVTSIFQNGSGQFLTLVLLQLALLGRRVYHDLGGADRVGGRVEAAALLDRVEEVIRPRCHGRRGRQQYPQHAAQLPSIVPLKCVCS